MQRPSVPADASTALSRFAHRAPPIRESFAKGLIRAAQARRVASRVKACLGEPQPDVVADWFWNDEPAKQSTAPVRGLARPGHRMSRHTSCDLVEGRRESKHAGRLHEPLAAEAHRLEAPGTNQLVDLRASKAQRLAGVLDRHEKDVCHVRLHAPGRMRRHGDMGDHLEISVRLHPRETRGTKSNTCGIGILARAFCSGTHGPQYLAAPALKIARMWDRQTHANELGFNQRAD